MSGEMHMGRVTAVLLCAMLSVSALGATGDDALRAYADSMARAVVANRDAVLLENFAPIMHSTYSDKELLAPLKKIQSEFGAISKPEFRLASAGKRLVGIQAIRTAIFTYALVTTKFPEGSFMKVDVTYVDGHYALAGYSVNRFVGNEIPPELRNPSR
jgi:hypothetical protein